RTGPGMPILNHGLFCAFPRVCAARISVGPLWEVSPRVDAARRAWVGFPRYSSATMSTSPPARLLRSAHSLAERVLAFLRRKVLFRYRLVLIVLVLLAVGIGVGAVW